MLAVSALLAPCRAARDSRAFVVVRHGGDNPLVTERLDPIVQPGGPSAHTHIVWGGNNFAATMGDTTAQGSTCTTAHAQLDGSNYWEPQLYFHAKNGSFFPVAHGAFNAYYL